VHQEDLEWHLNAVQLRVGELTAGFIYGRAGRISPHLCGGEGWLEKR